MRTLEMVEGDEPYGRAKAEEPGTEADVVPAVEEVPKELRSGSTSARRRDNRRRHRFDANEYVSALVFGGKPGAVFQVAGVFQ